MISPLGETGYRCRQLAHRYQQSNAAVTVAAASDRATATDDGNGRFERRGYQGGTAYFARGGSSYLGAPYRISRQPTRHSRRP